VALYDVAADTGGVKLYIDGRNDSLRTLALCHRWYGQAFVALTLYENEGKEHKKYRTRQPHPHRASWREYGQEGVVTAHDKYLN